MYILVAATRRTGGGHGGRAPGQGEHTGAVSTAPSEAERALSLRRHLEHWLAHCPEGDDDAGPVPPYVEREKVKG